jgi:hypothetical protein
VCGTNDNPREWNKEGWTIRAETLKHTYYDTGRSKESLF